MEWFKVSNDKYISEIGIILVQENKTCSCYFSAAVKNRYALNNRLIANCVDLEAAKLILQHKYDVLTGKTQNIAY